MKRIAVLGATGSIGCSTLEVIKAQSEEMQALGLTAHRNWRRLAEQCQAFRPAVAVLCEPELAREIPAGAFPRETELRFGPEAVEELVRHSEVDVVISGIVGAAGLLGTWAAIEAGKTVGVANKETLVVAGPLVMELARKHQATLIPVDSEHSAIYQALRAGHRKEVKRVILTASGGPFRGKTKAELEHVTLEQALRHPTWDMGAKITIDSATMLNKALEIVEARWLFELTPEQIEVVVHPQSVVHSFVEFVDGSVVAQLSPPDMKLPIQYALTYPGRTPGCSPTMDWKQAFSLHFEPPDREAFPALDLGFEVARRGGTCGAVLNAAKEAAVERFMAGDLKFPQIAELCRTLLQYHDFNASPTLPELLRLDGWAREEIRRWRP